MRANTRVSDAYAAEPEPAHENLALEQHQPTNKEHNQEDAQGLIRRANTSHDQQDPHHDSSTDPSRPSPPSRPPATSYGAFASGQSSPAQSRRGSGRAGLLNTVEVDLELGDSLLVTNKHRPYGVVTVDEYNALPKPIRILDQLMRGLLLQRRYGERVSSPYVIASLTLAFFNALCAVFFALGVADKSAIIPSSQLTFIATAPMVSIIVLMAHLTLILVLPDNWLLFLILGLENGVDEAGRFLHRWTPFFIFLVILQSSGVVSGTYNLYADTLSLSESVWWSYPLRLGPLGIFLITVSQFTVSHLNFIALILVPVYFIMMRGIGKRVKRLRKHIASIHEPSTEALDTINSLHIQATKDLRRLNTILSDPLGYLMTCVLVLLLGTMVGFVFNTISWSDTLLLFALVLISFIFLFPAAQLHLQSVRLAQLVALWSGGRDEVSQHAHVLAQAVNARSTAVRFLSIEITSTLAARFGWLVVTASAFLLTRAIGLS